MRKLAALLFDLDGTLIATKRLYLEAYRHALAIEHGRLLTDDEIIALRPLAELRFIGQSLQPDARNACLSVFYDAYRDYHQTHFEGVYPGVVELLAALRARRFPFGVVTGKSRRAWEITESHALLGEFDVFITDDDVTSPKPGPEGIQLALERLGAAAADTAYVGDSIADLDAARNAGVLPIGACWAKGKRAEEFSAYACEVGGIPLARPQDLLALI